MAYLGLEPKDKLSKILKFLPFNFLQEFEGKNKQNKPPP